MKIYFVCMKPKKICALYTYLFLNQLKKAFSCFIYSIVDTSVLN